MPTPCPPPPTQITEHATKSKEYRQLSVDIPYKGTAFQQTAASTSLMAASTLIKHPSTPGFLPRQLAARLLDTVLRKKQPFDEAFNALAAAPAFAMEAGDRAFARAIASKALRRLGQIEALVALMVERPLPEDAFETQSILLASLTQILFMKTPPHAAISLAVEQAKSGKRSQHHAALVNAVLRRASRDGRAIINAQDAASLNTPRWLRVRWVAAYGEAITSRICEAHLREPSLDLTVKSDPHLWAGRLQGEAQPWGSVRLPAKGRIEELEGYADGAWWVQDAAAVIPARLLGDVRGLHVADLCAAPGGKTAQLANQGAIVTAVDASPSRLRRLEENLNRLHLPAKLVHADARAWSPDALFDAVLLDAPCSATGTIRRNPDTPYLKCPEDIAALKKLQATLLAHATSLVKPGGRIVYSTCSLEVEEGQEQVAALLTRHAGIAVEAINPHAFNLPPEFVTPEGMLRTLPFHAGGVDGFFAVRLRRVAA